MASKHYTRFFTDARALAVSNAALLGRAMLPADEHAAIDELYIQWIEADKIDDLLFVIEGLFTEVSVLSNRIEFVIDFRLEFQRRNDKDRLHQLFERTISGAWKRYKVDSRPNNRLLVGNVARAALWKADILLILHEYLYFATDVEDVALVSKIKEQALSFYYENRFDCEMKSWRSIPHEK